MFESFLIFQTNKCFSHIISFNLFNFVKFILSSPFRRQGKLRPEDGVSKQSLVTCCKQKSWKLSPFLLGFRSFHPHTILLEGLTHFSPDPLLLPSCPPSFSFFFFFPLLFLKDSTANKPGLENPEELSVEWDH